MKKTFLCVEGHNAIINRYVRLDVDENDIWNLGFQKIVGTPLLVYVGGKKLQTSPVKGYMYDIDGNKDVFITTSGNTYCFKRM